MTDQELKDYLDAALNHTKMVHHVLSSVMAEVAALRETLLHFSPDWRDEFERQLKTQGEIAQALNSSAMKAYTEIIRRLRESASSRA